MFEQKPEKVKGQIKWKSYNQSKSKIHIFLSLINRFSISQNNPYTCYKEKGQNRALCCKHVEETEVDVLKTE